MPPSKRSLLWDYTNTANHPSSIEKLTLTNFSSLSNWNAWSPPELQSRLPFRPTVRGLSQITDPNEWAMISNNDHSIIYFFNEPERAGIKVDEAVEIWMDKMVPLRREKGKKLVTPGCASDVNGEEWLSGFMEKIDEMGEKPDYLALHYYGSKSEEGRGYIEKMHNKFPSYPIIISEIACISRDSKEVVNFTAELSNWMDECEYIFEYAWFGCMATLADSFVSPAAQLMDEKGELTSLMGKIMNEWPMTVD